MPINADSWNAELRKLYPHLYAEKVVAPEPEPEPRTLWERLQDWWAGFQGVDYER